MLSRFFKGNPEIPPDTLYYEKNKDALGLSLEEYLRLRKFDHWYVSHTKTTFLNRPFTISSPYWFLRSVEEIFIHEVYKFETYKMQPVIIDCGASWGLSVIYFKLRFPHAIITAYEADYDICKMALENLRCFNFNQVTLHNMAVWDTNSSVVFSSEGSVGGSVANAEVSPDDNDYANAPPGTWIGNYNTYFGTHKTEEKQVEAVRLKHILKKYVAIDFLKIDIEGAEHKVIMDCADELYKVDKMFIEYHSFPDQPQLLDEILKALGNNGFRYYIKEASNVFSHPYIRDKDVRYDLQLNIFCFR